MLLQKRLKNDRVSFAPKRSVQNPQREWIQGKLGVEMEKLFSSTPFKKRGWIDQHVAIQTLNKAKISLIDNSNPLWQWYNFRKMGSNIL